MPAKINISFSARLIGQLALAGTLLLILLTVTLAIVRNSVENDIVQRAASDLPLLKNRWPQFKHAIENLRAPVAASLANAGALTITPTIQQLMREITDAHSFTLSNSNARGRISAHIEIVYFDRGEVRPSIWYWAPTVDTGLTATELHTRVSIQQLEQTELILVDGPADKLSPNELTDHRRALIFFYLHTEWQLYETLIKSLVRSSQLIAFITVLLITWWVYLATDKKIFSALVLLLALGGLVIYGSLILKALSLRTVLTMMITVQFGPSANRAVDYAGLSLLAGAAYGLLLIGLMHLPTRPACPECKKNVSEDYRFCPHCNFVLKRNCLRCAAPVDTRWNYCPSCSEDI